MALQQTAPASLDPSEIEALGAAAAAEFWRSALESRAAEGAVVAWFRCFIRGENFPGLMIGEAGPVGFYITRFIEAADPEAAEAAALQGLRAEPKLAPPPGYTPPGQARVFFEEITEVAAEQVPQVQPGFAWHPMGEA